MSEAAKDACPITGGAACECEDQEQVLWSDAVSGFTDADGNIVIPAGVTVVLDQSVEIPETLVVHGNLRVTDTKDVTLSADNILVFGTLEAGTADRPHSSKFDIVLTGVEADPDVVMSDWMPEGHHGHAHAHMHSGPVSNKALLVAENGTLKLYGAQKESWTKLDGSIETGATEITVLDAAGWQIGDTIVIAPTGFEPHEAEERVITAIDGDRITLDQPVEFDHFGAQQDLGNGQALDMRAQVGNLTRSITISGSDEGERETHTDKFGVDFETGYGGHTMFHEGSTIEISSTEFTGLGITGEVGRYPVHFHLTGSMEGSFIKDSSVHHTLQRGMVFHQSDDLLIEDNVVYHTVGHQYYLEDGNEHGNQFLGNLGMLPFRTPEEMQIEIFGSLESNAGERTTIFWITNTGNDYIGNEAVGFADGQGFWVRNPVKNGPDDDDSPTRERGYEEPPVGTFADNSASVGKLPPDAYLVAYGPAWTTVGFYIQ
jgi:cell migration-inducing and hyaluronan-binding protein